MRNTTRRMVAAAKGRRASPEELREARQRLKEIDAELKQIKLLPETKQGEEREERYQRVLRLRAMRNEFQRKVRPRRPEHMNSLLLSLVMTVCSLAICSFFLLGTYTLVRWISQKPDATATGDAFWTDMVNQNYNDIYSNLLYPTVRTQYSQEDFSTLGSDTDQSYGPVTQYQLLSATGNDTDSTLLYQITRVGGPTHATNSYKVTLTLISRGGSWNISDLGYTFDPSNAGVPAPPTPSVVPTETPTDTETDTGQ